jgi:hypothetical protein
MTKIHRILYIRYHFYLIFSGEREKVRSLYSRLLERTSHVKVWLSYGQYEASEAVSLLSPPPPPPSSGGDSEGKGHR